MPSSSSSVSVSESSSVSESPSQAVEEEHDSPSVEEDGWYSDRDSVALYLHTFGKLPGNFITKKEASALGWDSKKGNLWEVAEGMSIGGDSFGNREGLLPAAKGRKWYECDINYQGGYRGAERILYSSDGLVYYTGDHYQTYTQLY
ncbi:MAG: ribonuclease [Oscillospiraceae bacterium]|nr:ribonuclease [Oscillospiraceae bacterium]